VSRKTASALAIGVVLRLAALPVAGTADVDAWKIWSYHATVEGVPRLYGVGGSPPERPFLGFGDLEAIPTDYPPLALYELGVLGHIYSAATHGRFTDGLPLTIAIKLFILAFDAAIAITLFVAVDRTIGRGGARDVLAAYAINPGVIVCAALLAYADVLFVLPAIGAIATAAAGQSLVAGALMAAAVLTKPQAIFIVPAVALAIWNTSGERRARRAGLAIAGAAAVSITLLAPIAAAGATANMIDAIGVYVPRRVLSMDCFNPWWIAGYMLDVGRAMTLFGASLVSALTVPVREVSIPSMVARGLPDVSLVGFILPVSVMAWALWTARRARDLFLIAALAAFLVEAYAMLSTDAHENHAFAVVPLLVLAAAGRPRFGPVAATITAAFTLNLLFYGFRLTDERNVVLPRTMTGIDTTLLIAAVNSAALVWFAAVLTREAARADSSAAPRSSPEPC
jgi:hypothetical protein